MMFPMFQSMMSTTTLVNLTIFMLFSSLFVAQLLMAGDPDILSDFIVPPNADHVDGNFFTHTNMRSIFNTNAPQSQQPEAFKSAKASMGEFPALNGQSVSYTVLQFPTNSTNPPHTHPRSAELLLLLTGALEVGFVDTTNKLFTQTLQTGDMFLFPKGLVHYQYNSASKHALAISAFGSANAGTMSLPNALFNSSMDDRVLAISFKSSVVVIRKLKAALSFKPSPSVTMKKE